MQQVFRNVQPRRAEPPSGARPPFGPSGGRQPIFNVPTATKWLCLALIAVHVLTQVLPVDGQIWISYRFAFVSAWFQLAISDGGLELLVRLLPTLVTHALLHADFAHLFLNTGFLLAFGSLVERRIGSAAFILLFCVTAAVGAITEMLMVDDRNLVMIGASGAVYGMMGAAAPFMFAGSVNDEKRRVLLFIAVVLGLNFAAGAFGIADMLAGASVAWHAHMGGFLAGLLLSLLFWRRS